MDIGAFQGLSEAEAADRLKKDGYNELPSAWPRSVLTIALGVVREPMFFLLVGAGALYLVLGDFREALILLSFVFVVIGITFYQERKTERALEALRDLTSPRALVIRNGKQRRIPGREVIRGDILVLAEGDGVPADAELLWSINLSTDESLLTGESAPVSKTAGGGAVFIESPGGDDLPFVYSGTLAVRGQGVAQVLATGIHTQIGKIGKALGRVQIEETPLQRETRGLVRAFAMAGLSLCAVVVVVYGLTRGDWLDGFLAGIALAMSLLPEEFPMVLTIFLALGAWRISQKHVLTRRAPAVETLGAATVLCVDKTGTLTLNRMSVGQIFAGGESYAIKNNPQAPLPDQFHELVEFAILASQRDPFDPMEQALRELGEKTLSQTEHLHGEWMLVREYPLLPQLLALSHVWRSPNGGDYIIVAKGAPEAIADLCHFEPEQTQAVSEHVRRMADDGLRVLGVAKAHFKQVPLPGEQHEFVFRFLGLVGLVDPVRPGVEEAIKECYAAGIRVLMITGDYSGTALHAARQIGFTPPDQFITGSQLDEMDRIDL